MAVPPTAIMAVIHETPMETLQLIDWTEALEALSAEPSEACLLLELLVTFYGESLEHVQRAMQAAVVFRRGEMMMVDNGRERPLYRVIKDHAHAIKGSAANLRLWRLAKAAEALERRPKMLTMRQEAGEVVGDDEIAALLHELCVSPQTEMAVLIEQMAAFVEFMEHRARDMVGSDINIEEELPAASLAEYNEITMAKLRELVLDPFAAMTATPLQPAAQAGAGAGAVSVPAPAPPRPDDAGGAADGGITPIAQVAWASPPAEAVADGDGHGHAASPMPVDAAAAKYGPAANSTAADGALAASGAAAAPASSGVPAQPSHAAAASGRPDGGPADGAPSSCCLLQ